MLVSIARAVDSKSQKENRMEREGRKTRCGVQAKN